MMGTGEFALPTFTALCDSPHEVVALYTQPDRTGRGHHHHPHPMKDAALERGIAVAQPPRASAPEALASLRAFAPDLCVVAAYGQILSEELLSIPRLGAINVHASLLPKHRGAAPVQYAVLRGDDETGVTIFQIVRALDAGPILGSVRTPIDPRETAGELEVRLAGLSVDLTLNVVDQLAAGTAQPLPQDDSHATLAPKIAKEFGQIDWTMSAEQIAWHVRAMQPWPRSFTHLRHPDTKPLRIIIHEAEPVELPALAPPGTVTVVEPHRLVVQTGRGALRIVRLQPEGKRAMSSEDFLHGHPLSVGDVWS